MLERGLGILQAGSQRALFENHFLEASLGLDDRLDVERPGHDFLQYRHLTAQPLVVAYQFMRVLDEQVQQTQQSLMQLRVVTAPHFELEPELAQGPAQLGNRVRVNRGTCRDGQLGCFGSQVGDVPEL